MSDKNLELLQDVMQIAVDGRDFYRSASAAVDIPFLKNHFAQMADTKDRLLTDLSGHITARGEEPVFSGTLVGGLRRAYADVLARLSQKPASYTYAAQLEEAEDRLLRQLDEALQETDSMAVRAVLLEALPRLRQSHDQIKQLRDSLAA